LRSITLGVGNYADRFDHLQELTGKLAERVMSEKGVQAAQ
jgi:elongation factor G